MSWPPLPSEILDLALALKESDRAGWKGVGVRAPEAVVGDITPHDGVSRQDKADRERSAAASMLGAHPDLWGLWEDYEKDRSAEARFVHQLDKLDMALQALRYAREQGVDTAELVASARAGLTDPRLRAVLDAAAAA